MRPEAKSLDEGAVRPVDRGLVQVVELEGATLMRTTFEPGWRWSECVKPIVGGESCQVHHVGYAISGRLHARMDTGEELECGPGDAVQIPGPRQSAGMSGWGVAVERPISALLAGLSRIALT
jgi:hypothetical protein